MLSPLQRQLLEDGAKCSECPLARNGLPNRPVPTSWDYRNGRPKLALVGEAPGQVEVRRNAVFVGPSGKLLDNVCRAGGVPRHSLAILNAGACGPIPSGADDVKKKVLAACRPRLIKELQRLQPKVILSVGGLALDTLAPDAPGGVTALRGALLQVSPDVTTAQRHQLSDGLPPLCVNCGNDGLERGESHGPLCEPCWQALKLGPPGQMAWQPALIPTLHPAFIMRGGDGDAPDAPGGDGGRAVDLMYFFLVYDLTKAWRFANDQVRAWRDECDLFLLYKNELHRVTVDARGAPIVGKRASPQELLAAVRRVAVEAAQYGSYSCDVETDAKDSLDANLTAVAVATVAGGMAATWEAWRAVPEALETLRGLLADRNLTKDFHNRIYDCIVLPRHDLPVANPIGDCYVDSETEFLTTKGWKKYDDVNDADLLATVRRDGALEWQPFVDRVAKRFTGGALVFETQTTRAVVTPNHRMWCRPVRRTAQRWRGEPFGDWGFVRADAMLSANTDSFLVQHSARPGDGADDLLWSDEKLQLLALWLTDGSLSFDAHGTVIGILISQILGGRAEPLLTTLKGKYPFRPSRSVHQEAWRSKECIEISWALYDRALAKEFLTFGRYSRERQLPATFWRLSTRQRHVFLNALFLGDGSDHAGAQRRFIYRSKSIALADAVQAMALSIGWTATNPPSYRPDGVAHVFIRRNPTLDAQIRARCEGRNANVKKITVDDRIVCFSVPNETLVTRSRGKPAFYGNTLLRHHAAFPGLPHKLDQVSQQLLVVSAWKTEYRKSTRNEPELLLYNYKDTHATALITAPLEQMIALHKTERVYESDRQAVGIAQRMREFGFWIDRKEQARLSAMQHARLEYMKAELDREFRAIAPAWFDRLARNRAIGQRKRDPENFMARVELRKQELSKRKVAPTDIPTGIFVTVEKKRARKGVVYRVDKTRHEVVFKSKAKDDLVALFEVLKIPFASFTEKGKPVTDKRAMEAATARHPLMRLLIHIREAQHLLATYIDGLPIKRTGRVHPDWSIIKIVGRWSAGKSQNIPSQIAGWPPEDEPDPNYIDLPELPELPPATAACGDLGASPAAAPEPPVVVNIKSCPPDWQEDPRYVYAGRPGKGLKSDLGNPHKVGFCKLCNREHTREEAVETHRAETLAKFADDVSYRAKLALLCGKFLVCFCAPQPCHCDIYAVLAIEAASAAAVPSSEPQRAISIGPKQGRRWKRKPNSGDYVTPVENARSLITAPTVEEILEHARVAAEIYEDPKYRSILERAKLGYGRKLYGADYSQLHLRIVALLGQDKFLVEAYAQNADIHAINAGICFEAFTELVEKWKRLAASTTYGDKKPLTLKADLNELSVLTADGCCPWCSSRSDSKRFLEHVVACRARIELNKVQKPWKMLRDLAKRLVYAWIYRGKPETAFEALAKVFPDVKLHNVADAFRRLDENLPGWVAWCARNEIAVRREREVRESLHGRVRLFPLGNYNVTIAVNFPVIGFETALVARALFRFAALTMPDVIEEQKLYSHGLLDPVWVSERRREGFSEWRGVNTLVLNGHDSLDGECDEVDADRALSLLLASMDQTVTMDGVTMRFPGEGKVGRRLSET